MLTLLSVHPHVDGGRSSHLLRATDVRCYLIESDLGWQTCLHSMPCTGIYPMETPPGVVPPTRRSLEITIDSTSLG